MTTTDKEYKDWIRANQLFLKDLRNHILYDKDKERNKIYEKRKRICDKLLNGV